GGIIVIDFIDMANPKNRELVEEELKQELERDRTKTYVVEISPLGLVEMTRQNVTDGPREILTKRCPTCHGDGIVVSETTSAVDAERRLRALAAQSPRTKAFKVELNAHVAAMLIGAGAERLKEIERATKRTFLLEGKEGTPLDHFTVLDKGSTEKLVPESPFKEGQELDVKLGEVGLHDSDAGMGKLDGHDVCVGGAAKLVGKKVKIRVERVMDSTVYASLVSAKPAAEPAPITAEGLAGQPTRSGARRGAEPQVTPQPAPEPETIETEAEVVVDEAEAAESAAEGGDEARKRKKTRRGSRGGRRRRKPTAAATTTASNGSEEAAAEEAGSEAEEPDAASPRIHLPDPSLGARSRGEPSA